MIVIPTRPACKNGSEVQSFRLKFFAIKKEKQVESEGVRNRE